MTDFILQYLSGLTGFAFDKTVLQRIAWEVGVSEVTSYNLLTKEQKDKCKIKLLETVLASPNRMASSTSQHGAFSNTVGSQTITEQNREDIKKQLRKLYEEYGMEDEIATLDDGNLSWIDENEY